MIKPSKWRAAAVAVLAVAVTNVGFLNAAQAGIVATSAIVRTDRDANLATIRDQLDQSEVKAQMEKMGVDAASIDQRIAALSDSELHSLAKQMQDAPAGGDAIAVIGVVFLVLLILELVGIIDIFKKT
ncbi:MAG TPA: PA2779 family protein [Steroidobacteraceae bacterium]|nr:PA2779 family protein [Steroidobacteraceae bacterium]HXS31498.1 PA2779 family protein [Steroidobacteraceae bacterium]